jgi:CBS domain containing-hemolysin-like protein
VPKASLPARQVEVLIRRVHAIERARRPSGVAVAAELLLALALVAANGFFVASEFAIARLRPTQVAGFMRQGRPGAKSAQHAIDHIDAYLSATQLGITVASLGLGAVGEPAFHDLLEPLLGDSATIVGFGVASAVAFLVITVLHVVLGELAPKSAAIARTGPMALTLCPPMRAFYLVTKPLVDGFNGLGNLVLKPFGIPPASEAGHAPHSEDELRDLLRESRDRGLIERDEQQLSDAALVFGDRRAREVMTPRSHIDFATSDQDAQQMAETAMAGGHTRLPLCMPGQGLEDTLGFVHAKDLLRAAYDAGAPDVASLARPLARVAESTRVDEVLREMRRDRRHLALVLDEHGTVVGLITLEDILEEIVGEIEDEFDAHARELIQAEDGGLRIDGAAPLRLVAEQLGIEVDAPHETTIGGHVTERIGRLPEPDEVIVIGGARLRVLTVDDTRITALQA